MEELTFDSYVDMKDCKCVICGGELKVQPYIAIIHTSLVKQERDTTLIPS